jgi:hypothetical protein
MPDVQAATVIKAPEADFAIVKSKEPTIYVPARLRIGGLDAIRPGAAIVGTLQSEGTVAIDVESTPYVDPTPQTWSNWVLEAARRHAETGDELELEAPQIETRLVSSDDLVEVGRCENGCVLIEREARPRLQAWLQAGRTATLLYGRAVE